MSSVGSHKARISKPRRSVGQPDPELAAESARMIAERHEAFVGDFHERWAERLTRPVLPAAPVSKLARPRP